MQNLVIIALLLTMHLPAGMASSKAHLHHPPNRQRQTHLLVQSQPARQPLASLPHVDLPTHQSLRRNIMPRGIPNPKAPAPAGDPAPMIFVEPLPDGAIRINAYSLDAGQVNARRYDCRTTSERLATIERRQEEDAATFGEHAVRLRALEAAAAPAAGFGGWMAQVERRLVELENWKQGCEVHDEL